MVLQAKTVERSFSRNNEHNLLRRTDILGKGAVGRDQASSLCPGTKALVEY